MTRRLFLQALAASVLPAESVDGIVSRFAQVARPILTKRFGQSGCISSTRTTIEVLRHFKIPARPLVCRMKVRDNETGRRHVVGPGVLTGRAGLSGFAYHLVAIAADRLLIDASADQINHRGFRLPGVLVAKTTYGFRRGHLDLALEIAGQAVTYEPVRHAGLSLPLHDTRKAVAEILAAMGSEP